MLKVLIFQLLVILFYATCWFVVAIKKKRNDVADVAWGGGFICAVVTAYLLGDMQGLRPVVVLFLILIWGFRLLTHIGLRNRGKPEDHRYKKWREEWGESFLVRTYFQVFLFQGLLSVIISLPVTWTLTHPSPSLHILDFIGIITWTTGFFFETVGDYQLLRFKQNPVNKGKIMKYGLWHYTRHPNYFGEVTMWWGVFLICISVPGSYWTIIGPLTITYLILKVSGTPMLERKYTDNPEYRDYIKTTSSLFPLPPKKQEARHGS